MLTTVRHVTSCMCPVTKSLIHVLCMSCVLDVFWPMAARLSEVGVGHRYRGVRWLGGVGHNYKSRQMAAHENFKYTLGFPSPGLPRGQRGQQSASVRELILYTPEESEPHFYHWETLKKELRKKKTDHSSTEGTQPLRGTAVYLCRFHSLR